MTPYYSDNSITVYLGDCREILPQLEAESAQVCVTSPPYWGLRDYGVDRQLGLENSPERFVAEMVDVFGRVRRVIRKDGTLWLNLGDSYCSGPRGNHEIGASSTLTNPGRQHQVNLGTAVNGPNRAHLAGIKPKDLVGIPWEVALALRSDGWWLRSDVIWSKPNPMPESVTDRPTKAHEYLFLLTRSAKYFYDADAVREDGPKYTRKAGGYENHHEQGASRFGGKGGFSDSDVTTVGRNLRTVWTIPTQPYPDAHFATFPQKLVEPCILAGTSEEGACVDCGAPWQRRVEKTRVRTRPGRHSKSYDRTNGEPVDDGIESPWRERPEIGNRDPGRHVTATKTVGWEPTCSCRSAARPCVVLDPFMGSGTTAVVARANGCRFTGIELNEEYCEMAVKRLEQKHFNWT